MLAPELPGSRAVCTNRHSNLMIVYHQVIALAPARGQFHIHIHTDFTTEQHENRPRRFHLPLDGSTCRNRRRSRIPATDRYIAAEIC
jgi:hypothetical protein